MLMYFVTQIPEIIELYGQALNKEKQPKMKIKRNKHQILTKLSCTVLIALFLSGCFSVKYDFKGGVNIPPHIQSFSVQMFENRAQLIEPTFSQRFTNGFKDYLEGNTNLRMVSGVGDIDFSGTISTYEITPQAISANDQAAMSRFTIAINLNYKDQTDPENDFERSISAYRDFENTKSFNSVEASLSDEIMDEIIELAFNAAFVNW